MKIIHASRALLALAVLALGASAGRASASGFQLLEQNGSGLGNAHAGAAAAAEDASTIFFNPAGMARVHGRQLVFAGNLVQPYVTFDDAGSSPGPLQPTGGEGGDAGSPAAIPSAYFSWEVAPNVLWAGVGVNAPFGLMTEWDADWVGRFHAIKSDVKTINVNPSLAFRFNEYFSIGAGANYQWITAELSNAVNYSALVAAPPPAGAGPGALPILGATCTGAAPTGAGCQGVATVKGDDRSWSWNVGILIEIPSTETRIGATYRSSMKHELEGNVAFANRPAVLATNPRLANGDIRTEIELPDSASIAISQQLAKLQLLADFSWTGWSKLQSLDIFRSGGPLAGSGLTSTPLEFEDSWRVGLGANYQFTDPLKWRVGVAYDTAPVKDEFRTPRLPDQDRIWLATGAQFAVTKALVIDAGLAWLFVKTASSNLGQPPATPAFPAQAPRGTVVGSYTDNNVWIAALQGRYTF
jgi:long-chain fatty acid transport protein